MSKKRRIATGAYQIPLPVPVPVSDFGRFPFEWRMNADTIPLNLEHLPRTSYTPVDDKMVQIPGMAGSTPPL